MAALLALPVQVGRPRMRLRACEPLHRGCFHLHVPATFARAVSIGGRARDGDGGEHDGRGGTPGHGGEVLEEAEADEWHTPGAMPVRPPWSAHKGGGVARGGF